MKPGIESEGKKGKKNGLSFSEKREFEALVSEIENLYNEKIKIEADLSGGALDSNDLLEKSRRHGDIIKMLDDKELRWLELSEKGG